MAYRKLRAERLFDGYRFREDAVLVVEGSGLIRDILTTAQAGEEVEKFPGILMPGMVNCHCHLELSHMRGLIPEDTGLVDFVFKVVTERHHPEEEIREAIARAEEEMLQNGIVAVGDICNNLLTLEQKKKQRLHYYNFIEASGWLPSLASSRFEKSKAIFENFRSELGIHDVSIVPHAPYSVSEDLWRLLQQFFENRVVSIHNQETVHEDEFFLNGTGDFQRMYELMKIDNAHHRATGRSSLQSYFDKLKLASSIILVHNTCTRQKDVDHIKRQTANGRRQAENGRRQTGEGDKASVDRHRSGTLSTVTYQPPTFFCLCVNANQYIENALPPIELLRKNGVSIVLGTDSLASNWSLNLMDEIKTIRNHSPSIPLEEILQWATINGARALEMDKRVGSFEKGKKPGIVSLKEVAKDFEVKRIL